MLRAASGHERKHDFNGLLPGHVPKIYKLDLTRKGEYLLLRTGTHLLVAFLLEFDIQ
jgi:hypothetical protein